MQTASKQLFGIEENRHWSLVDQLDLHCFLKASGLTAQPEGANALHEMSIQRVGEFRPCRGVERRPLALSRIPIQSELRDGQHRAADLRDAAIHLAFMIFKDAQAGDL